MQILRILLFSCLAAIAIHVVSPAQSAVSTDAGQLQQLFDNYEQYQKELNEKTFPDVLPAAQEAKAAFYQSLIDQLSYIDKDKLSDIDQINYEVFRYILQDVVDRIRLEDYLIPFNAEGGFYTALSYLGYRYDFSKKEDYQEYANQLRAFPQFMRDNMKLMRIGLNKGMIASRLIAANYEVLIQPFLEKDLESHLLMAPYARMPQYWPDTTQAKLFEQGSHFVIDSIRSIYEQFDRFMQEEYLPKARTSIGISDTPTGKELYEQRIAFFTSLNISPEEVFQKGQEEVARIRVDMEGIIKEVGFEGSFDEFLAFLRTDPQFYAQTPREILMEASYIAKKIDGKLPAYFNTLPRLPYGIQPVPAAIAPNYTSGRYSPGNPDKHRAGNYWVNTTKLDSRPLYALPALTLHEAVPGHHLQFALAQEMEGLPKFRNDIYLSAFGEGWALYCELLGKEMGIYETPYEEFGRLTYEMWRACRLVVDVGMHYKGWSREKAFNFLASNTALSVHECNTEINRYIGWPGQAVSYKMGELFIRELRAEAEDYLGEKFNIREFHDVVLEHGSVPLYVLRSMVKKYMWEKVKSEK